MELLPGESILCEWDRAVTLTNRRIRLQAGQGANAATVSITLDAISSCALVTASHWWLLIAALLGGAFGISNAREGRENLYLGIAVSVICIVAFLLTRAEVVKVSSANGVITRRTTGKSAKDLLTFIDAIEAAKLAQLGMAFDRSERTTGVLGETREGAAAAPPNQPDLDALPQQRAPRQICTACELPVGPEDRVCPSCGNAGTMDV